MLTMAMRTNSRKRATAEDEARWAAVVRRDPTADFYYSVKTTGVFCRTSCPARLPNRQNVQFHDTIAKAQRLGFRACKRCKPDEVSLVERQTAVIAQACRAIESAEEEPGLDRLAQSAGWSKFHFHRIFKSVTGITPKAYAAAHRVAKFRGQLKKEQTVTRAAYNAGFNSGSRVHASKSRLGMAPSDFRAGGRDVRIRFAVGDCSLGAVLVAATDHGVCAIMLGDEAETLVRDLQDRFANAEFLGPEARFDDWIARVVGFVEMPGRGLELPLDIRGTVFQQRVWEALRKIPFGSTASYSEIARSIGSPKAVRAVAQACGANPVALAIPCHRVIRTDGALCGYRWGVERKRVLLERERAGKPETRNQKSE